MQCRVYAKPSFITFMLDDMMILMRTHTRRDLISSFFIALTSDCMRVDKAWPPQHHNPRLPKDESCMSMND